MTLLAAFKVLLYRYTGQPDILVGSPLPGGTRCDFRKGFIGFFCQHGGVAHTSDGRSYFS